MFTLGPMVAESGNGPGSFLIIAFSKGPIDERGMPEVTGLKPECPFASSRDQPILMAEALQRSETPAMAPGIAILGIQARKSAIPTLTIGTFVTAASAANLLVGTMVFVEFIIISLVSRNGRDILMGFWLVLLLSVLIWMIASLMCVVVLTPRWLCTLAQRLFVVRAKSSPSEASGVWDLWLDGPHEYIGAISSSRRSPWFGADLEQSDL
jgi:hypothetical protein